MAVVANTTTENPFGLSDSEAARVRINALRILFTLKAEQDNIEGKIRVREIPIKQTATH